MTQDSRLLRWKSPTMVGRAVAKMVWSRAARNSPSISPDMITRICRWVKPSCGEGLAVVEAGELIGSWSPHSLRTPSTMTSRSAPAQIATATAVCRGSQTGLVLVNRANGTSKREGRADGHVGRVRDGHAVGVRGLPRRGMATDGSTGVFTGSARPRRGGGDIHLDHAGGERRKRGRTTRPQRGHGIRE